MEDIRTHSSDGLFPGLPMSAQPQKVGSGSLNPAFLGHTEVSREVPSHLEAQKIASLAAPLPGSGYLEPQKLRTLGSRQVLLVDHEVGRGPFSILFPQKGTSAGIRVKEGSPTFLPPSHTTPENHTLVYHVQTGRMTKEALHTSQYAEAYLPDVALPPNYDGSMDPWMSQSVYYFAGDIPSIIANSAEFMNPNYVNNLGLQHGFKFTSVGSILTGALSGVRAKREMEVALRIEDAGGQRLAWMRAFRTVFEMGSGLLMLGVRTINILQLTEAVKKIASVAYKALNSLATAFGIGNYIFLCLPLMVNAVKSYIMGKEFDRIVNGEQNPILGKFKGLKFLMEKLSLNPQEKQKIFQRYESITPGDLYKLAGAPIQLNEDESKILNRTDREEIRQFVDGFIRNTFSTQKFPLISDIGHLRQCLAIKVMKNWAHKKMTKEAKYLRRAGQESLNIIKSELAKPSSLQLIANVMDPETQVRTEKLFDIVRKEMNESQYLTAFLVTTCAIGIIGMIVASAFTGGVPLYVAFMMMFVSNILMTGVDLYGYVSTMQAKKNSNRMDRIIITLFGALSVFCILMGASFAGGGLPLIAVIIGGIVMAGLHAGAFGVSLNAEAHGKKIAERDRVLKSYGWTPEQIYDVYDNPLFKLRPQ